MKTITSFTVEVDDHKEMRKAAIDKGMSLSSFITMCVKKFMSENTPELKKEKNDKLIESLVGNTDIPLPAGHRSLIKKEVSTLTPEQKAKFDKMDAEIRAEEKRAWERDGI